MYKLQKKERKPLLLGQINTIKPDYCTQSCYLSLPPTRRDLTQGQWPEGRLQWGLEEGKVRHESKLEPSLTMLLICHLVRSGPDEPSWTWTQIWVQVCMPGYSLNWTARSTAIQRCQWCSSPTQRWSSWSQWPSGLRSAIEHWQSGTDAGQSAEKPLHILEMSKYNFWGHSWAQWMNANMLRLKYWR